MTGTDADRLVDDYLARLDAALDRLPAARAEELVDEIDAHISEARAELPGGGTEAELRTLLDRIGEPEEIARDALGDEPQAAAAAPVVVTRRGGWVESLAVALLPFGGLLIPLVGWFAGVALLWSSDHWTLRDKLIGTLAPPGGYFTFFLLTFIVSDVDSCSSVSDENGTIIGDTCDDGSAFGEALMIALIIVLLVLPLVTMVYLLRRRRPLPVATA